MRVVQIIAVVALLGIQTQAARRGYLSSIGPAPLRFEAPGDPAFKAALPPLAMNDLPATNVVRLASAAPTPAPTPADQNTATVQPQPQAHAPSTIAPVVATPQPLESQILDLGPSPTTNSGQMPLAQAVFNPPPNTAPGAIVSPQMLVPLFIQNQSTNSARITTIAPITFAPPVPNQPLSSSATYLTPLDGTRGDTAP